MEGGGEPPVTRLQSSHAAPTELDSAERPLRYKHVAPAGAWTNPRENPCKEQSLATALHPTRVSVHTKPGPQPDPHQSYEPYPP